LPADTSTVKSSFCCVRWYLRFKLSLRDLVEMMAERGVSLAHTTIMRWVHRYTPEFEKRWRRFAVAVGRVWRVDETYVKIKGEWCYRYSAVNRVGRTGDFS
jgi:transposase-like protein